MEQSQAFSNQVLTNQRAPLSWKTYLGLFAVSVRLHFVNTIIILLLTKDMIVSDHNNSCLFGHNHVWAQIKCVWAQSCLGTIVSGHNRVWAQSCLGTIVSGHNRVWAQSCLGTIVSRHNRVWAQSCLGTVVWAQSCMGTNMVEPKLVLFWFECSNFMTFT